MYCPNGPIIVKVEYSLESLYYLGDITLHSSIVKGCRVAILKFFHVFFSNQTVDGLLDS